MAQLKSNAKCKCTLTATFYVLFSDFQWYVFNIFATYTLGNRDVHNFEKKRKDSVKCNFL